MTFWFCIGTAAELIKMYPVISEADNRKIDWFVISTGQSGLNLWNQYKDFNLPENRFIKLNQDGQDLSNSQMALAWFFKSFVSSKSFLRSVIEEGSGKKLGNNDRWFVHGDTLSTLLGSFYARRLKIPLVHVEAGLRSHSIASPFPEEICRRIVSRLSDIHMAQDVVAANNLKAEGIVKNVYITNGNTVMDALNLSLSKPFLEKILEQPFALANFHRFENLSSKKRWDKIIETILKANLLMPVVFVLMPNAKEKIEKDPALKEKLLRANVRLLDRQLYSHFIHLLNQAEFLITDGGSNQQECFHMAKPCLILRDKTESIEGIGGCCVLSKFSDELIEDFLKDPSKYKITHSHQGKRPTEIIFESLQS